MSPLIAMFRSAVLAFLSIFWLCVGGAAGGVFRTDNLWAEGTKLRVCFLDGDLARRLSVVNAFAEWLSGINAIGIDFGDRLNPQSCTRDGDFHVRVTFKESGNWAFPGASARHAPKSGPTMSLQVLSPSAPGKISREVLHEVGHVLGMEHEHQSPASPCENEFEFSSAKLPGFSKEVIESGLRRLSGAGVRYTEYDRQSVMHYGFSESFFKKGKASECFLAASDGLQGLSIGDRKTIQMMYGEKQSVTASSPVVKSLSTAVNQLKLRAGLLAEGVVISEHMRTPAGYLAWSLRRGEKSSVWRGIVKQIYANIDARTSQNSSLAMARAKATSGQIESFKMALEDAANRENDTTAQLLLAKSFYEGVNVVRSSKESIRYLRAAADRGDLDGAVLLALFEIAGIVPNADIPKAVERISSAADKGHAAGMLLHGAALTSGIGVRTDNRTGLERLTAAAKAGAKEAHVALGVAALEGLYGDASDARARSAFEKGAQSGDSTAKFMLGILKLDLGPASDRSSAFSLIKESASEGIEPAQSTLAYLFRTDRGLGVDEKTAMSWNLKAAESDYIPAQFRLGLDLLEGDKADYKIAVEWLERAALLGHPQAQYRLADAYSRSGTRDESVRAIAWMMMAARSGDAKVRESANARIGSMSEAMAKEDIARAYTNCAEWTAAEAGKRLDDVRQPPKGAATELLELTPVSTGTATLISRNGFLLTNQHVIESCDAIKYFYNGSWQEAKLFRSEQKQDLAILRMTDFQPGTAIKLRKGRVSRGLDIHVAGFPLPRAGDGYGRRAVVVNTGSIKSLTGAGLASDVFEISTPLLPGNSGGPVLDGSGALVGLLVKRTPIIVPTGIDRADIPKEELVWSNEAIKLHAIRSLIESYDEIPFEENDDDRRIQSSDLEELAKRNILLVNCYQQKSAAGVAPYPQ